MNGHIFVRDNFFSLLSMAKIFITGSADGLGKLAAQLLVEEGHDVFLHGRNSQRAKEALTSVPKAKGSVVGDLSELSQMKAVADQINQHGAMDAVIHNAAVGYQERKRKLTPDGIAEVFAVNSLAPFVLTSLMHKPKRLIYMSSQLHRSGDSTLQDLNWDQRPWSGYAAYSDSKLHNVIMAFSVSRLWPNVLSNAIDPGWVPTRMGGPAAPDDLMEGRKTQAWLAVTEDPVAQVSGKFFYHKRIQECHPDASDVNVQDRFLATCEQMSGIRFPQ